MNSTKYILTARQREVVNLRLQGDSYKQIAQKLGITYMTVKSYLDADVRGRAAFASARRLSDMRT